MNNKRTSIVVVILTILMTVMEMLVLPSALFINIRFKDINPIYFALIINFIIGFIICWICKKTIIKEWNFGLQSKNILSSIKKYGIPAIIGTIIVTISFVVGLVPFDNKPTIWRIIVECFVYYIGVGIFEEIYLRGLLQNIIEKWFEKRKNGTIYAIFIASVLFGLGHIFGAIGQPIITVICKTIWATALGVYLGSVYVLTRNLWIPIILHFIINLFISIPFCFSTSIQYPTIALVTCVITYLLLAIYGIRKVQKSKII